MFELKKPLVYVSSPFRGDTKLNLDHTKLLVDEVLIHGGVPICSHLMLGHSLGAIEEEVALEYSQQLVDRCDIYYEPLPIATPGMLVERERAMVARKELVFGSYTDPYNLVGLEKAIKEWGIRSVNIDERF